MENESAGPVAYRSVKHYSPDVGSWYEYYDEFRDVNDKSDLTPLYEKPQFFGPSISEMLGAIPWSNQMAMDGGTMIELPIPWASRERGEVKKDLYTAEQMHQYGESTYLKALDDLEARLDILTSSSSWRIGDVYYSIKLLRKNNGN